MKLRLSRITTLVLGVFGLALVAAGEEYVYTIVGWGWAGLAGCFAPVMTLSFFWERFSKAGVYASFIAGLGSTILWVILGFDTEIVTVRLISFPIAFIAAVMASLIWPEHSTEDNHEN